MTGSEENQNLVARFNEYFKVGLAESDEDKESVYKVRYRVYCEEFEFLDADNYEGEMERDEFDDVSPNCLITHHSGLPAACVRLVFGAIDGKPQKMPYEVLPNIEFDESVLKEFGGTRDNVVEISRLAVDGAFRRRSGEALTRFGEIDSLGLDQAERRTFGLISVAAFFSSAAMAEGFGRTVGVAMMEPFLPRLMSRSGIIFKQAGPAIDYHGKRAPYVINLESFFDSLNPDLLKFYESIRHSLFGTTE